MLAGVKTVFSDDMAIDLGTANTLVHVANRGVVLDEPSVVAIRNRNGVREVWAVGAQAKQIVGRTPEEIEAIRPMRDGVIADFIATEEMLRQFIKKTKTSFGFRRPRILICVPAGATPVERRAVYETALSAGARKVYLIEEPVAAALGAGLEIDQPKGLMVVDIGGGTTDTAVLSAGSVILARSLRCAGNSMDEAIVRYIRNKHFLMIGEIKAEMIKVQAGTALGKRGADQRIEKAEPGKKTLKDKAIPRISIRGQDVVKGKIKNIILHPHDIAEALTPPVEQIAEFVLRSLEELEPDTVEDICRRGIYLTGGGAQLVSLDAELKRLTGVDMVVPKEPTHCVVKGTAAVLQNLTTYDHLLIKP